MKSEQLNWFWKSFKGSFKTRLIVCLALTLSVGVFDSFPLPLVRVIASVATLVTAELFILFYFPFFWDTFKLLFKSGKAVEMPLPDELLVLARQMGMKITKMKIFPKIYNAYARGNQLFMGQELLDQLDSQQIKAVAAHEFGHIKGRHALLQFFYMLPVLTSVYLSWASVPLVMLYLGMFAYMMVIMVPIHWWMERRADFAAVKYVGKEAFRSVLLEFGKKDKLDVASETHPSINQRIKWIDEAKL